jgi:tripartite-type tricarboxylate transporter receptor subunit TctC
MRIADPQGQNVVIGLTPFLLPGTPKDRVDILQDAMRKVFKDPEFRAEFHKLVSDEVSPLMPEDLAKVIREMPRDPEVIEMLKKFAGVDPLPRVTTNEKLRG